MLDELLEFKKKIDFYTRASHYIEPHAKSYCSTLELSLPKTYGREYQLTLHSYTLVPGGRHETVTGESISECIEKWEKILQPVFQDIVEWHIEEGSNIEDAVKHMEQDSYYDE